MRKIIFSTVKMTLIGTALLPFISSPQAIASPSDIDNIMYFDADIRDAEFCQLSIKNNQVDYGSAVTNPAMTCPDAFSWHLFAKVIDDQFWIKWANESQNWPKEPWPLCAEGVAVNCCDPTSNNNNLEHCPVFPGDELATAINKASDFIRDDKVIKNKKKQLRAAVQFLKSNPELTKVGTARQKGKRSALKLADSLAINECSSSQIKAFLPNDPQSIGRVLRQSNAEITIRNKAFHDYLFDNDLYNADGVLNVYRQNDKNQAANAPYHQANQSASASTLGKLATIDLPPDAIMIKSNWVSEKFIAAMEKKYPAAMVKFADANAYIRQPHVTVLGSGDNQCKISGSHFLMSFHVSSKDIPQWVWTTFEHMSNPGRCDYTGCNDSFGHSVNVNGQPSNYINPHQKSDDLASNSTVFSPDLQYPVGTESAALSKLFNHYGIASSTQTGLYPNKADKAWDNYRLKGSQVDFTDHQGRSTHLGNSITEAGFMSRSSCIGCHSRAGVAMQLSAVDGKISYDINSRITATASLRSEKANFLQLGVFEPQLSEFGYEQSHDGIPNHNWFYNDDSNFTLKVLQTDFIWGFLNAQPLPEFDLTVDVNQPPE